MSSLTNSSLWAENRPNWRSWGRTLFDLPSIWLCKSLTITCNWPIFISSSIRRLKGLSPFEWIPICMERCSRSERRSLAGRERTYHVKERWFLLLQSASFNLHLHSSHLSTKDKSHFRLFLLEERTPVSLKMWHQYLLVIFAVWRVYLHPHSTSVSQELRSFSIEISLSSDSSMGARSCCPQMRSVLTRSLSNASLAWWCSLTKQICRFEPAREWIVSVPFSAMTSGNYPHWQILIFSSIDKRTKTLL